jgi:hypothetical protein
MAQCEVCKKEMTTPQGCIAAHIQYTPLKVVRGRHTEELDPTKTKSYVRIPYGHERRYGLIDNPPHCPDCNAPLGLFHHPGCDWEECPRCGFQLLACACNETGQFADVVIRTPARPPRKVKAK